MEVVQREFSARDLVGGDAVLDFVNTVTGRDGAARDWLDGYPRLLDWAALTRAFRRKDLARLREAALASPRAALRALARARRLREALYRLFAGAARGKAAARAEDLRLLETEWRRALAASELQPSGAGAVTAIRPERAGLDLVILEMAVRAVALLEELPGARFRQCGGSDCAWLFIDTSKGGRRRWCDMSTCGNVSKARRHAARRPAERVSDRRSP